MFRFNLNDFYVEPENKKNMSLIWQTFKIILFSITMIFKSIVDRSLSEPFIYKSQGMLKPDL